MTYKCQPKDFAAKANGEERKADKVGFAFDSFYISATKLMYSTVKLKFQFVSHKLPLRLRALAVAFTSTWRKFH